MEILFDKKGEPKVFRGKTVFGSTTTVKPVKERLDEYFSFDKRNYAMMMRSAPYAPPACCRRV